MTDILQSFVEDAACTDNETVDAALVSLARLSAKVACTIPLDVKPLRDPLDYVGAFPWKLVRTFRIRFLVLSI